MITVDYCPETMANFDALWDARLARVDAQLQRVSSTAYFLGWRLGDRDITRTDANRRLEALTAQRHIDDETWVPAYMAEEVAADAFRRGMEQAERGAA